MRIKWDRASKKPLAVGPICFILAAQYVLAHNLGQNPQVNIAVRGQTGAQPEGAFLNFINWVGKVIAPLGAGGADLGAVVVWVTGRGFGGGRSAMADLRFKISERQDSKSGRRSSG